MKKLLILGANPETAGLVRKANEKGIYTIITDNNPNAYAKRYADKVYNIDATDLECLYQMAVQENVDGIILGVAESLMSTYAELCMMLNKPCYGNRALFDIMSSKDKFKQICIEYGVPVVPEYKISVTPTDQELSSVEYPVVVKPVDSCSSKGISVCKSEEMLGESIKKALEFSRSGNVIVEKYMTCDEVVIYYIVQNGTPVLTAICDRYTNKEQEGVAQLPTSYIFPSRYTEGYISDVDHNVKEMFKSIGVQNGPIFIQSFVENGKFKFYEPGYRLNGAQEHYIVSAISGIDAKELMINFALTGTMGLSDLSSIANPKLKKWACKLSPLVREGKIAEINGLELIKAIPEVISINMSYDVGDIVVGLGTLKQIICRFFIVAETQERLSWVINEINKSFIVKDIEGVSMMLTSFDPRILQSYGNN